MNTREVLAALRTIPRLTPAQEAYIAAFEATCDNPGQQQSDALFLAWSQLSEKERFPIVHIFVQLGWQL